MLIHKDALRLQEVYNIKLNDNLLMKLEDAYSNKRELLVTIAASHYGLLNGNKVVYRHNTVKNNIGTFLHPHPKPIITNHRPKESKQFGRVIAVDYKLTDFDKQFSSKYDFDNMSTSEYMNFCKDEIIPFQEKNNGYNGLGYCEVVGKIDDEEGIRKVLNGEFLRVSIGADPKKLVCSHCLQDQMIKMCDHYATKQNGIFFLAEELEYEELSFLTGKKNPADPGAKVTTIHDEEQEAITITDCVDLQMDLISAEDFFRVKLADSTKTIVCVDNICKIVNQEETMGRKAIEQKPVFNISYLDEFTKEELGEIALTDSEDAVSPLTLTDEKIGELKNSDFAIVQKGTEGTNRRFPIFDAENVQAAVKLFDKAKDLSPSEVLKAKAAIIKAAKKLGIEAVFTEAEADAEGESDNGTEGTTAIKDEAGTDTEGIERTIETLVSELQTILEGTDATKLTDEDTKVSPLTIIFSMLQSVGSSLKWAGDDLKCAVDSYLKSLGEEAINKTVADAMKDEVKTLTDSLAEAQEDIELLDEMNRDLNVQIRCSLIDEIVDTKAVLGILKDSVEDEKAKLVSYPYNILVDKVNEFRELKLNLKDGVVNNKQEIKTITDPTLTDSDNSSSDTDADTSVITDEENIPTEAELVALLIKGLRGR